MNEDGDGKALIALIVLSALNGLAWFGIGLALGWWLL